MRCAPPPCLRRLGPLGRAAALALLVAGPARADLESSLDLRLRYESFSTPAAVSSLDRDYDFALGRLRFGLDGTWGRWRLHGVLQGHGAWSLPERGAFGSGPVYLAANRGETDPSGAGVAEASVAWEADRWRLLVGRLGYTDGVEKPTGVKPLDELKRLRWGERLVGNLDFANAGRRYDGLSFAGELGAGHLALFYLEPLAGAFDQRDAFSSLDDLRLWGGTYTAGYGAWLPHGEVRLFGVRYDDERPGARAAAGGTISLDTLGASLLFGGEADAVLAWVAVQRGDFGPRDHDAWAAILGAQHRFLGRPFEPALYVGVEHASGDGPGRERGAFFNLVPTNHKFYGSLDYSAFSNLRDHYVEARFQLAPAVKASAALHQFALSETGDAWYGGSGAFNDAALGYQARRPPAGDFPGRDLGRELDLELAWAARPGLELRTGAAWFWGSDAARAVLRHQEDGGWAYVELNWRR